VAATYGPDLSGWRDELGRAFETAPDELIPLPRQDETRAARMSPDAWDEHVDRGTAAILSIRPRL
jgi:hypothetical protein